MSSEARALFSCIALIVALHATIVNAAACGPISGLNGLHVARPKFPHLPDRDRIPYPEADATVTCSITTGGKLSGCSSTLGDPRGEVLAEYVGRWSILTTRSGGCKVVGRKFVIQFRLRDGEQRP